MIGYNSLQVKELAVLQTVPTTDKAHSFPCLTCIKDGRCLKLATHFPLVWSLRMRGVIPPFIHTFLQSGD
jgi:hypothetical protein